MQIPFIKNPETVAKSWIFSRRFRSTHRSPAYTWSMHRLVFLQEQEVKVIWQKAPHGGPIPRLGVTPGGRKLYHW